MNINDLPDIYDQKYVVIAACEGGNVFSGMPRVIKAEDLTREQQKADRATGGNWSEVVLHEFTITQYA